MIASTPWVTKLLSAWICLAWSPWASLNLRLVPRLGASDCTDLVSAVRQALSAPIWEKPTVMPLEERGVVPEACVADEGPERAEDEDVSFFRSQAPKVRQKRASSGAREFLSVRGMGGPPFSLSR